MKMTQRMVGQMKRRKYWIIIVIAALCLVIALMSYSYIIQGHQQQKKIAVSIIVHSDSAERWENFRQGIQQAAIDLNATINFITMSDDVSAGKQISLIRREWSNGTQGMIISAFDSEKIGETIAEVSAQIPVVMAETDVSVEVERKLEYISADNAVMGEKLAKLIMEAHNNQIPVYILKVNEQRSSIQEREQELAASLTANGYTIHYWQPGEGDFNLALLVQKMMKESEPGVVAALDETTLEGVLDGAAGYRQTEEAADDHSTWKMQVYGIGSTSKIVYHLNQGNLEGIVFQDEYHMGYTSMVQLLSQIASGTDRGTAGKSIESYAAQRQTLHQPEMERLLYPIIQ